MSIKWKTEISDRHHSEKKRGVFPMILDDIIARKKVTVAELKKVRPLADLQRAAELAPPPRDFYRAIQGRAEPAVIAEIKRASPSAGLIRPDLDIDAMVKSYENGGASAISVITEEHFFQGKLEYLRQVRAASHLPVLCKDFIIDPFQVFGARAAGADALLLIAACLDPDSLMHLLQTARSVVMACLVEVHDGDELNHVLATDARIIGIKVIRATIGKQRLPRQHRQGFDHDDLLGLYPVPVYQDTRKSLRMLCV